MRDFEYADADSTPEDAVDQRFAAEERCVGTFEPGESFDPTPELVPLEGAEAVAIGGDSACALVEGGRVWCWGQGSGGELGNGREGGERFWAQEVPGLAGVTRIAKANDGAICAVVAEGVKCWGGKYLPHVTEPTLLTDLSVIDLALSESTSALLDDDGGVWRWNRAQQNSMLTEHTALGEVRALVTPDLGVSEDGQVGYVTTGTVVDGVEGVDSARYVFGISSTFCVADEGKVFCGVSLSAPVLEELELPSPFASFGTDPGAICFVLTNHEAYFWLPDELTKVLDSVTMLSGSQARGCAVLEDTTVACWGGNTADPRDGNASEPTPATVLRPAP